uniref:Ig-like domain-containing protein n=1 Tax=Chelonoidis abingdonii TaxID=106734 RepID=A0A8C0JDN0_CHEAB
CYTKATPTPPSVFPLVPCCTKTGNAPPDTSLACLVTGYFPSPVEIKWNSGKVTKGVTTFPEVTMSNGRFTQSSLLIIPARSRQGDTNQCDVTHQGTATTLSKTFPQEGKTRGRGGATPRVQPAAWGAPPPLPLGHLPCMAPRPPACPHLEIPLRPCLRSSLDPTIYLTKPSYEDVIKNSGRVTCLVLGYDSAASSITWKVDGQVSSAAKTEPPKKNSNGTTSLVSSHPVSLAQWGQGTQFTCKSYSSLAPLPFHLGIRKKEPSVTISRAYHEDTSGNRVSLTLICEASGFYPEEISISWLKNNSPELKSSYNNGPVSGSGIFSAYSILKVDKSGGAVNYTCVVHHPAMKEPKRVVEKVSLGKWILRVRC